MPYRNAPGGRLSRDAWQTLHEVAALFDEGSERSTRDPIALLDQFLILVSAIRGTTLDNMVRSHAWTFLDMGRRVERGTMSLTVLGAMLAPGAARVHMEVLLEVADSLLTYRARYLSQLQVAPVVDLLLTDDSNPRSVVFQASELVRHVSRLPHPEDAIRNQAERRAMALASSLMTLDVVRACSGTGDELRAALSAASELFWQFANDVEHIWFSHTVPSTRWPFRVGWMRSWRSDERLPGAPPHVVRVRGAGAPRSPPGTSQAAPARAPDDAANFARNIAAATRPAPPGGLLRQRL